MMEYKADVAPLDRTLVEHADLVAQESPDPSTKTGAVIARGTLIITQAFNRFPKGVERRPERFQRPDKYLWTEHSERVALDLCARFGTAVDGATIYSNWWPCAECSRGIVEAGIRRVVGIKPDLSHPKYGHEFEIGLQILQEGGVEITFVGEREQVQK